MTQIKRSDKSLVQLPKWMPSDGNAWRPTAGGSHNPHTPFSKVKLLTDWDRVRLCSWRGRYDEWKQYEKRREQHYHNNNKADNICASKQSGLWQPAETSGKICPPSALRTLNCLFYILTTVWEKKTGPVNHQVILMEEGKHTVIPTLSQASINNAQPTESKRL